MPGASVTIKDSGGTVLDSGTTDSGGNFSTTNGCGSNRTVVISQAGYTTTTLTGQTLGGSTLNVSMAANLDTTNNVCCLTCAYPKVLHWTRTFTNATGTHTTSGSVTWRSDGTQWGANFFGCVPGAGFCWGVSYDDPFTGAQFCWLPATSITCDPLNVTFGLPDEDTCPNYQADTGVTASSLTVTA